jgi:hypothetical protein
VHPLQAMLNYAVGITMARVDLRGMFLSWNAQFLAPVKFDCLGQSQFALPKRRPCPP